MTDDELKARWAVIDWIARLPLLGAPELALLMDTDEREASSLLSELRRGGWLHAVRESSPELELGRLHALSRDGERELSAAVGLSTDDFSRGFPVGESEIAQRRARVEITAGVNRLAAEIAAATQREKGLEIKDLRALPTRRAASAWWPAGVEAFGCLQTDSSYAPFFVAWDRAGASRFHRGQRVSAWAAFRDSQQPWGYQGMPSILVLCPGQPEASQWEQGVSNSADRRLAEPLPVLLAETKAVWSADPFETVWRRPGDAREAHLTDLLNWRRTLPPEVVFPEFEMPYIPLQDLVGGGEREESHRLPPPLVGGSEKELLRWLGAHPLLTADELKVLVRARGHGAAHLAVGLVRKGLVDCVARPLEGEASGDPRYFLTAEGLSVQAEQDGVPPRRYVRSGPVAAAAPGWPGAGRLETLLRQLDHTAGVNRFVVRLIDEARRQRLVVADWLSASEGAERFEIGGAAHWLRPDALLRVRCNDNLHRVYVEWDRGTMRLPEMREKFRSYAAYCASISSTDQDSPPPFVLIVTTTPNREAEMRRILKQEFDEASTALSNVLTTTSALLERLGPLGRVWLNGVTEGRLELVEQLQLCVGRGSGSPQ